MIRRMEHHSQYVLLCCDVVRSGGMTLEALGLYARMLIRPDRWEFYEHALAKETGLAPEKILSILLELESKGFVKERQGRFGRCWDLFEAPDRAEREPDAAIREIKPQQEETKPEETKPEETKPEEPPKKTLTNEQMAQIFFDQAAKLKSLSKALKAQKTESA